MAVFLALIVPLPFTVKRKLFAFISESPVIAKLQYGLKVTKSRQKVDMSLTNTINLDHIYLHPDFVHRQRQPGVPGAAGAGILHQGRLCTWVRTICLKIVAQDLK